MEAFSKYIQMVMRILTHIKKIMEKKLSANDSGNFNKYNKSLDVEIKFECLTYFNKYLYYDFC